MRNLIDDAGRNPGKEIIRKPCPIHGHKIIRRDSADGENEFMRTFVSHHADCARIGQHGEELIDLPIKTACGDFLAQDGVGFADGEELFLRHFPHDANGKSGTGERLPPDHIVRQAQRFADAAYLVFEEHAQRFNDAAGKALRNVIRQTANVVMGLDDCAALD